MYKVKDKEQVTEYANKVEESTQEETIIEIKQDVKVGEVILEAGDKIKVLEKTSNFNVGDRVKVSEDGLKIHSRKTPAHMGFSQFTIDWRNKLLDIKKRNVIGTVERIFPSGSMNVDFEGTIYDVPEYVVEHI